MPVFISYSSKDQRTALTICKALESRGQRCWISCRDVPPGENFQESIVRALRGAHVMLLVFSSNANNSEEIKKELVLAGRHHVTVIPVRVEDVTPNDAFAYEFATRQWVDLFLNWDQEMETLLRKIAQILEAAPEKNHAESWRAPPPIPQPDSRRPLLIGVAVILLVVVGAALAFFKPWDLPNGPPALRSSRVRAAEFDKKAPVAATAPLGAPATAIATPSHTPEQRSSPMVIPKPAPKRKAPVQEATAAHSSTPMPSQVASTSTSPPLRPAASTDDDAWITANAANTRDGLAAYLKAYPSGAHSEEAQFQIANLILSEPATGTKFDGRWRTVWTCPNVGKFLGYSYQFDGQVTGGVYHGVKGNKGEPSSMVLDGNIDSDGSAAFTGEVIVGSSATGMGAARGTASDFHAVATFSNAIGAGRRLEGRGCSLSFNKS